MTTDPFSLMRGAYCLQRALANDLAFALETLATMSGSSAAAAADAPAASGRARSRGSDGRPPCFGRGSWFPARAPRSSPGLPGSTCLTIVRLPDPWCRSREDHARHGVHVIAYGVRQDVAWYARDREVRQWRVRRWGSPWRTRTATGSTGSWLVHSPQRDLLMTGTVDRGTAGAVPFRAVPRLLRAVGPAP